MIKIQKYEEIENEFFENRTFGQSIDVVNTILEDVQKNGDEALKIYGEKFDVCVPSSFEISKDDLKAAAEKLKTEKPEIYDSIVYSKECAFKFAKKQRETFTDFEFEIEKGVFTGQKTIPVEKAGCYIPAGRFPLVSTVIMTVIPAIAAGVDEVILCTPPRIHPDDKILAEKSGSGVFRKAFTGGKPYADESIMAAAYICGANRVFACGGSQAIAAMAYGTKSIPKVNVIAGPGNKFVAAAKKAVYGNVGIDMIAGPTEVMIIADKSADCSWVAADLLAQAEHDTVAQPVLVTDDEEFAQKVCNQIEEQLKTLKTSEIARKSIDDFGKIIIVKNIEQAIEVANKKAPEHLEVAMDDTPVRKIICEKVRNYGSLFIGHNSAEVFGDYSAGINHTLPTSGSAKFTGGLSVRMFLKTVTSLKVQKNSEGEIKSATAAGFLGDAEGLSGHAKAARIRLTN